jgi:hypothetical protein
MLEFVLQGQPLSKQLHSVLLDSNSVQLICSYITCSILVQLQLYFRNVTSYRVLTQWNCDIKVSFKGYDEVRLDHGLTQEQFNLEISRSIMILNHIKTKKTISKKFVGKSQFRTFSRPKACQCQNRNARGAYDGPVNLDHVPRNYITFKH